MNGLHTLLKTRFNTCIPKSISDNFIIINATQIGFEELANMSRRIRHATDASSITGGSSINGNLQEAQDETDGAVVGSILSNVLGHPTNNINWFRSEIQRLKFGKFNSHSTSLLWST